MNKKIIIYCAEYLLFLNVGLLVVVSFQDWSVKNQLGILLSAGILSVVSLSVSKILKRIIHRARPPKNEEFFKILENYFIKYPSSRLLNIISFGSFFLSLFIKLLIASKLLKSPSYTTSSIKV